jgi:hypothetical protein
VQDCSGARHSRLRSITQLGLQSAAKRQVSFDMVQESFLLISEEKLLLNIMMNSKLFFRSVDYFNAKGSLIDKHTVEATSKAGKKVCIVLNIYFMLFAL